MARLKVITSAEFARGIKAGIGLPIEVFSPARPPSPSSIKLIKSPTASSTSEALAKDWANVGNDIRRSISSFKR